MIKTSTKLKYINFLINYYSFETETLGYEKKGENKVYKVSYYPPSFTYIFCCVYS